MNELKELNENQRTEQKNWLCTTYIFEQNRKIYLNEFKKWNKKMI